MPIKLISVCASGEIEEQRQFRKFIDTMLKITKNKTQVFIEKDINTQIGIAKDESEIKNVIDKLDEKGSYLLNFMCFNNLIVATLDSNLNHVLLARDLTQVALFIKDIT